MTNQEAISYLCNLRVAIGRTEYQALWHYEQPLAEIVDMLSEEPKYAQPEIIRCKDCYWYEPVSDSPYGPRCDRLNIYPTENFYCAGAKLRGEQE